MIELKNLNFSYNKKKVFKTNVNFLLKSGQVAGVTGNNGTGKTTLLKIIAGVYKNITGIRKIDGSVLNLISLSGFMDLNVSVKQNIFLANQIFFPKINFKLFLEMVTEFSGIKDTNMITRQLSNGYLARLGYACLSFEKRDIILSDENIFVADQEFKKKCLDRIQGYLDQGSSLIIAGHDLDNFKFINNKFDSIINLNN